MDTVMLSQVPFVPDVGMMLVTMFVSTDDDGNVGMVKDVVADAAEKGASDGAETATANDDEVGILLFSTFANGVTRIVGRNCLNLAAHLQRQKTYVHYLCMCLQVCIDVYTLTDVYGCVCVTVNV